MLRVGLLVTEHPGLQLKIGLALSQKSVFLSADLGSKWETQLKQENGIFTGRGLNFLEKSRTLVAT